jgi:hypothetical protein
MPEGSQPEEFYLPTTEMTALREGSIIWGTPISVKCDPGFNKVGFDEGHAKTPTRSLLRCRCF